MTISSDPQPRPLRSIPIADALIAGLSEQTPEPVLSALRTGEVGVALRRALDAGNLAAATDVLRIGWFDFLLDDDQRSSRDALENLSAGALTSHPLLAMALGIMYGADGFRRSKAAYYFGLASLGIRSWTERTPASERALVLASESVALRMIGNPSMSARSARAGVQALEEIRDDRATRIGYLTRLYSQLGTSLYYGGAELEALTVFARGYAEAGQSESASFGNVSMMAGIRALAGDMTEAADHVALARSGSWTDEQRSMYTGTFYRLAEALIALERFDTDEARKHLDAMVHDRRSIEHWVAIAHVEALTGLLEGNPAGALARLEAFVVLRGAEGQASGSRAKLSSIRSVLHLALGNYEAAANVLKRDAGTDPQDHVDRARLALVTGGTSEALRQLRAVAGHTQNSRTLAQALSLETAIALRSGYSRRSELLLQQLASVLRQSHQRVALHLIPDEDFQIICDALSRLDAQGAVDAGGLLDGRDRGSLLVSPDRPRLTVREQAVLEAMVRSASRNVIAAELFVSPNTVKTQTKSLYRKLGARNREEAITIAMHRHLLPESSPSDT